MKRPARSLAENAGSPFGLRVVGAGEVGRAANHFRHRRHQRLQRSLGGVAGGDVLGRFVQFRFQRAHGGIELFRRQVAADAALELGAKAGIEGGDALAPFGMHRL